MFRMLILSVMRAAMSTIAKIKSHLEARPHQMLVDNLALQVSMGRLAGKKEKKQLLKRMMMTI